MINQVTLLGKVQGTPVVKTTQNGTAVLNFVLVTTEKRGETFESHYHRVSMFGYRVPQTAPMLTEGAEALVIGKIWARQLSNTTYPVEIVASIIRVSMPPVKEQMPEWQGN